MLAPLLFPWPRSGPLTFFILELPLSPDICKVYACVFRPVKSPMCTLYKYFSLKLLVKFINMR